MTSKSDTMVINGFGCIFSRTYVVLVRTLTSWNKSEYQGYAMLRTTQTNILNHSRPKPKKLLERSR